MEFYAGGAKRAAYSGNPAASLSPFAFAAPRLRENGLSVLPIAPNGKLPGCYGRGDWRAESKWQRFCERLPTQLEMDLWSLWPDAGVAVPLGPASAPPGLQLVAVDLDTDDPDVSVALAPVVPPSPVRKRGLKGETGFYLASAAVKSRAYRGLLDLLANGRQTVVPPSVHPHGIAYTWLTLDTLESVAVADLPVLTDDVAERIGEALKPWGYKPPPALRIVGNRACDTSNKTPHRALNEAALANLDAWVPELQLTACSKAGTGYRAVAHWRPSSAGKRLADREPNLSIKPEGIRDWGDGRSYTALDLVMAASGFDLDTVFAWLCNKVAPQQPITLSNGAR